MINLVVLATGGRAEKRTAKYRMSNNESRRMEVLREIFYKTDRIHSFDVRCWTFDVRCSLVLFFDLTGRGQRLGITLNL